MSRSNEERELGKLLKEISFDINRIQKVSGAIEQTLREAKRLFQQIKKSIDQYETGRRLFLGQLKKDGNSLEFNGRLQEFQNVADATPTPNALAPLTPEQRTLIRTIVAQGRRLQTLRTEFLFITDAIRGIVRLFVQGVFDEDETLAALFALAGEFRRIREEIQEVRGNLAGNVIELAASLGL